MAVRRERAQIHGLSRSLGVWGATCAAAQAATIPDVTLVMPQNATPMFVASALVTMIAGGLFALANAQIAPLARSLEKGAQKSGNCHYRLGHDFSLGYVRDHRTIGIGNSEANRADAAGGPDG